MGFPYPRKAIETFSELEQFCQTFTVFEHQKRKNGEQREGEKKVHGER